MLPEVSVGAWVTPAARVVSCRLRMHTLAHTLFDLDRAPSEHLIIIIILYKLYRREFQNGVCMFLSKISITANQPVVVMRQVHSRASTGNYPGPFRLSLVLHVCSVLL